MNKAPQNDVWMSNGSREVLDQLADLFSKSLNLEITLSPDEDGFDGHKNNDQELGVSECTAAVGPNDVAVIELLLARSPGGLPLDAVTLFKGVAGLDEKVRLLPPRQENGGVSLFAELRISAKPMSLSRASALSEELNRLNQLAILLQENLPRSLNATHIKELYKAFKGALDATLPWPLPEDGSLDALDMWADETFDFVDGSSNIAIASPHPVELNLALAVLAGNAARRGSSLGALTAPTVNAKALLDLAAKAPGPVIVPAVRLSLGSSPYELGNEIQALLASLADRGTPVIFSGALGQLQSALNGGQGAVNDPLLPVVRHVPSQEISSLVDFAVHRATERNGGLPASAQAEICRQLKSVLASHALGEQRRILPIMAASAVRCWRLGGRANNGQRWSAFSRKATGLSETLGGLSARPRARRLPQVQEHYCKVLSDQDLLTGLRTHLLGQDRALGELFDRLRMEALTRPMEQPLRVCSQGTPATGKSESAVFVANALGIPYVNIDAASMPDFHTAASQLLGSGRGIVMSHMPGRLEQVAKHHAGCVVEISDLDHAVPHVRAPLADLFLQMLETGEAQSATGAMFSCANLILFFTMNLPGGADEEVRKGLGFGHGPSPQEVQDRVVREIKHLLSGAFLSRVGRPILFDPLDKNSLALILERAVMGAIKNAAQRKGLLHGDITRAADLGSGLLAGMGSNITSFGARAILEHGRSLAAEAFCRSLPDIAAGKGLSLHIALNKEGYLVVEQNREE